MATQVELAAEPRDETGKSVTGRLRKTGRVPGILYGNDIDSQPVHVDTLELYHAMHTEAGRNVLIRLQVGGEEHLSIIRDIQRHAVRGDVLHVDFQNVDRNELYPAEIPVHLENEESPRNAGGIVNLVLYTVPIMVKPLETPTAFTLDLDGMEIGDVLRVEDLGAQLPADAEWDIEPERTVVTINAPMSEEALESLEDAAGIEEDESETTAEAAPAAEAADEAPAEGGDDEA